MVKPIPATALSARAPSRSYDVVDCMMRWEEGEMGPAEELDFLRNLRDDGMLARLQGAYGRRARALGII